MKRRLLRRPIAGILAVILTAGLNSGMAFGYQNYPTNYGDAYQVYTSYCINATSVTWSHWTYRLYVPSSKTTLTSQENSIESYINGNMRDRLASTYDPNGTNLYAAFGGGHDPRGWAYAVYHNTPSGCFVQDYRYSNQNTANLELVWNLYLDQGNPQGVIVGAQTKGSVGVSHAILAYDAVTTSAPGTTGWSMVGFFVLDPWYGSGLGSIGLGSHYPSGGYAPSTLIGMSNWNNYTLLPMVAHGFDFKFNGSTYTTNSVYYQGYYNLVLRAQPNYGPPTDNAANASTTYSDYLQTHGAVAAASAPAAYTYMPTSPTIGGAVHSALQQLEPALAQKNTSLVGVGLGTSVHVDSLDPNTLSYELVDLGNGTHTVAVAKVDDEGDNYRLGSIQWVNDAYKPFDVANQSAYAIAAGLDGQTRLVWAMSEASWSPFQPLIDVATSSGHQYLGPLGVSSDFGR